MIVDGRHATCADPASLPVLELYQSAAKRAITIAKPLARNSSIIGFISGYLLVYQAVPPPPLKNRTSPRAVAKLGRFAMNPVVTSKLGHSKRKPVQPYPLGQLVLDVRVTDPSGKVCARASNA
jgi:hypothetical protein